MSSEFIDPRELETTLEFAIKTCKTSLGPATEGPASHVVAGLQSWIVALVKKWGVDQIVANKSMVIAAAMTIIRKFVDNPVVLASIEAMLSMFIDSLKELA